MVRARGWPGSEPKRAAPPAAGGGRESPPAAGRREAGLRRQGQRRAGSADPHIACPPPASRRGQAQRWPTTAAAQSCALRCPPQAHLQQDEVRIAKALNLQPHARHALRRKQGRKPAAQTAVSERVMAAPVLRREQGPGAPGRRGQRPQPSPNVEAHQGEGVLAGGVLQRRRRRASHCQRRRQRCRQLRRAEEWAGRVPHAWRLPAKLPD